MKQGTILLNLTLFIPFFSFSQGSSCGTAIPVILDSVCRNYAISSSTSNSAICSYRSLQVTYFSFTTNASAECVLLNVTELNAQPCEVDCNNACHTAGPGVTPIYFEIKIQ